MTYKSPAFISWCSFSVDIIIPPFFRIDKSRSRAHGGVGLGHSLVWEIAALHGGTAETEESSENGTVMLVTLPKKISWKTPYDHRFFYIVNKEAKQITLFNLKYSRMPLKEFMLFWNPLRRISAADKENIKNKAVLKFFETSRLFYSAFKCLMI